MRVGWYFLQGKLVSPTLSTGTEIAAGASAYFTWPGVSGLQVKQVLVQNDCGNDVFLRPTNQHSGTAMEQANLTAQDIRLRDGEDIVLPSCAVLEIFNPIGGTTLDFVGAGKNFSVAGWAGTGDS